MPPPNEQPELLMPVTDTSAALQFFVEAMKANTAVLQGIQAEQKETLKLVHDTRERVIRIEAGGQAEMIVEVRAEHAELRKRIDDLERGADRRAGVVGAMEWASRFGPWLLALILGLLAIAGWDQAR